MPAVLSGLNVIQLRTLLWFAEILAQEVSKLSTRSHTNARHHEEMDRAVSDATQLMRWGLGQSSSSDIKLEALRTYLGWVLYAQTVWSNDTQSVQQLRSLLELATPCLLDDEIASDALEIFRDMLDSYASFFQPQHMDLLSGMVRDHFLPQVLDDSDSVTNVQFIVALGSANIDQVIEQPSSELQSGIIITAMMKILQLDGIPGDSDVLTSQTIEFWNAYVEHVNEQGSSRDLESDPPWLQHSRLVLMQATELLYHKLWIPTAERHEHWTDTEHEAFKEFRLDCADTMGAIWMFLGKDMLRQLVSFTLQFLEAKRWRGVEAALYCLNALSEHFLEDLVNEEVIAPIFESDLFIQVGNFSQVISTQTRRTAISTLSTHSTFIAHHDEYLRDTVKFLFACLEVPSLANAAAKSIELLCSTCRTGLTTLLPDFLAQYQRFLDLPTNNPFTKQKVIGAIASIIQALTPESAQAQPLLALISNLERDVEEAKTHAAAGDMEMAELVGVAALECLARIGKQMQVPNDDEDETDDFWASEGGLTVQGHIINCFSVLSVVGTYSAAVDAACEVLRSGFSETRPGPFVLPPIVTVDFLRQCTVTTAQIEAVLTLACTLIKAAAHPSTAARLADEEAGMLFQTAAGFAATLGNTRADPGVATGCIELWTCTMPVFTKVFFANITAEILDFTLTGIDAPETFPKKAACYFWTDLLNKMHQHGRGTTTELQARIDDVNMMYGPKLVQSLTRQLGGHAQRSDLEYLCNPLQVLLRNQPRIKSWLEEGLSADSFPGVNMTIDQRKVFVTALLRVGSNGHKVKEVVKQFWAACRGTVVTYSS